MHSNPLCQRIYSEILGDVTDDIERQVFDYLASRPGQPVRRETIIFALWGYDVPRKELAANRHDRMVRAAVHNLQLRGAPILASAGSAGYMFSQDPEQLAGYIAELESRREELSKKINGLRKSRQVVQAAQYPERAEQGTLFNMATTYRG